MKKYKALKTISGFLGFAFTFYAGTLLINNFWLAIISVVFGGIFLGMSEACAERIAVNEFTEIIIK